MTDLDYYIEKLTQLTRHRGSSGWAPHKPCLLLTVLDLVEFGAVANGRVEYVQVLETGFFSTYFNLATGIEPGSSEWRRKYRPFDPFWHLKNEDAQFWKLFPRPGREREFEAMPESGGKTHHQVLLNVAHAELDCRLFALTQEPISRAKLRRAMLDRYFSDARYENLRQLAEAELGRREQMLRYIKKRDPKFPKIVMQAYKGKCAATGEKIVIPSITSGFRIALVEVAHLIPYCISFNNNPQNGIVLQPTYHKAMDEFLIAPGLDGTWHVSDTLKSSRVSHLVDLDGAPVLIPDDESMRPWKEGLRWRMNSLRA